MRDIIYLPDTRADFLRIYEHYAFERQVPDVAIAIETGIRSAVQKNLPSSPEIGRRVKQGRDLRAILTLGTHWVFYTHDQDAVFVHRVMAAKELISWNMLDV